MGGSESGGNGGGMPWLGCEGRRVKTVCGSLLESDIRPDFTLHSGGCKVAFGQISPCIGADFIHSNASENGEKACRNGAEGRRLGVAVGRRQGMARREAAKATGDHCPCMSAGW